jgi:hypothetical protein
LDIVILKIWTLDRFIIKCLYYQKITNECARNALNDATDFKLFVQKNYASLYVITCSLGQVDEKINHMKISSSWNFEIKSFNINDSFIKLFN